jgi:hypothetical protein
MYHSEKKEDSVKKYKRDSAGRRPQFRYGQQLPEKMESLTGDMTIMFDWLMEKEYAIDFDGLKREFPGMSWTTLGSRSKLQDWKILRRAAYNFPNPLNRTSSLWKFHDDQP